MRYRMLVTDLDYTCLDEMHEIPEVNLRAAQRAMQEGIIFSIATGRGKAAGYMCR
ncbi:MAG: HAD family hydrolase [Bacillus subtilis]|nr:HAD family hydrolase [Bacillus subtilis]